MNYAEGIRITFRYPQKSPQQNFCFSHYKHDTYTHTHTNTRCFSLSISYCVIIVQWLPLGAKSYPTETKTIPFLVSGPAANPECSRLQKKNHLHSIHSSLSQGQNSSQQQQPCTPTASCPHYLLLATVSGCQELVRSVQSEEHYHNICFLPTQVQHNKYKVNNTAWTY